MTDPTFDTLSRSIHSAVHHATGESVTIPLGLARELAGAMERLVALERAKDNPAGSESHTLDENCLIGKPLVCTACARLMPRDPWILITPGGERPPRQTLPSHRHCSEEVWLELRNGMRAVGFYNFDPGEWVLHDFVLEEWRQAEPSHEPIAYMLIPKRGGR